MSNQCFVLLIGVAFNLEYLGFFKLWSLSCDFLKTSASSASTSMPSQSISAKHHLSTEPGLLQCKASETSFPANVKSAGKKRKKSPQKKKEEKSSKKQKKSKSPRRGYKRESRSTSPSLRKRSRSR